MAIWSPLRGYRSEIRIEAPQNPSRPLFSLFFAPCFPTQLYPDNHTRSSFSPRCRAISQTGSFECRSRFDGSQDPGEHSPLPFRSGRSGASFLSALCAVGAILLSPRTACLRQTPLRHIPRKLLSLLSVPRSPQEASPSIRMSGKTACLTIRPLLPVACLRITRPTSMFGEVHTRHCLVLGSHWTGRTESPYRAYPKGGRAG